MQESDSATKAHLLIEHFAHSLVSIGGCNMSLEWVCACVKFRGVDGRNLSPIHRLLHCVVSCDRCTTLNVLKLTEDVRSVILLLLHTFIVVIESWLRHSQGLVRDGSYTSQVCLIAFALENSFLSQLDPVLLFQLLDETLEELLLVCHFSNLGIDLHSDTFLHAALVHFVSTHLGIELHVTNRSEEQTSLVELVAELLGAFLFDDLSGVNFPVAEKLLRLVDVAPLVNPCHDNLFVAFSL